MVTPVKAERIQLRATTEAKALIQEAAACTQQDATSFILDAATARARSVLLEQHLLRLAPADIAHIERALDESDVPVPELQRLFQRMQNDVRLSGT